jgi:hypothetical protein
MKNKRISLIILIFLIVSNSKLYGQVSHDSSFCYLAANFNFKVTTRKYFICDSVFYSKRKFHLNSFADYGILRRIGKKDSNKNYYNEFKIDSLGWNILDVENWIRFFSYSDNKIERVLLKSGYWIEPDIQNKLSRSNDCYKFTIRKFGYIEYDTPSYWLNPKFGIVIIEGMDCNYIRTDFLKIMKYE